MHLHSDLPFSSLNFFIFLVGSVLAIFMCKQFLNKSVAYKYILAIISSFYIAILFPKPLQLVGLIVVSYFTVLALKKWYKSSNIILPMMLLAIPIFLMKSMNIVPMEGSSKVVRDIKNIVQIAGLSYLVFKVIGLYIDERNSSKKIRFLDFFNFTAFVPTLLIGPIDRFSRFQGEVSNGYKGLNATNLKSGWNFFLKGVFYKFIVAECIRRLVLSNIVPDDSFIFHAAYAYTYIFYLFFDFAGYSLLAIAFANFLGISIPINFDKPFLATNPKEFWKKWHKSLGDWLGDYFFKPIFKDLSSRKVFTSITRQNIALFLTFTLMGFWNGFELHYIVSGIVFGLYSVIHNYYIYKCKRTKKDVLFGKLGAKTVSALSILLLFHAVVFSIYIFSGNLI